MSPARSLTITALVIGLAAALACGSSEPSDHVPALPELVYMERDETTLLWSIRGYTEGSGTRELVPGPDSLPRPRHELLLVRPTTGELLYPPLDAGHGGYILYDPLSSGFQVLPLPGEPQDWSPTGDLLTSFGSDDHQVVTLAGGVLLTVCSSPLICGASDWAPAGDALVNWSRPAGEQADLWRIPLDGGAMVNLTNTADVTEIGPSHSPDGQHLAYLRNNGQLVVMNADGTNPRQLIASAGVGNFPWSPDGSRFAAEGSIAGQWGLAVVPLNGEPRLVTPAGEVLVYANQVGWSPDGNRLAYTAFDMPEDLPAVFVINEDGTGRRQISASGNHASLPIWMPDLP